MPAAHKNTLIPLRVRVVAMALAALCPWHGVSAQDLTPAQGRLEVRSAYTELRQGVYYLNARLDLYLGESAVEALANGVNMNLELQINVSRSRLYIWDSNVASLRQRYQLSWHALTERFVVANVNSGERNSYADLESAVAALAKVENLPVIDASLLEPGSRYSVGLRATMDVREMSGPLRFLTFLWGDWRTSSDWYTWPLRQ